MNFYIFIYIFLIIHYIFYKTVFFFLKLILYLKKTIFFLFFKLYCYCDIKKLINPILNLSFILIYLNHNIRNRKELIF